MQMSVGPGKAGFTGKWKMTDAVPVMKRYTTVLSQIRKRDLLFYSG